jgi:hypothetical protein
MRSIIRIFDYVLALKYTYHLMCRLAKMAPKNQKRNMLLVIPFASIS